MEVAWVALLVSGGLGVLNIIRTEQVRRSGSSEEQRKKLAEAIETLQKRLDLESNIFREKLELFNLDVSIIKTRLQPLFSSFDKRLADMLHQPHVWAERLDHLIEEYQTYTDPDTIPPDRLQSMIDEVWEIHQQSSRRGAYPNPVICLTSGHYLSLLDGRRDARPLVIEHAALTRELDAKQQALDTELGRLRVEPILEASASERMPWWNRLWWKRLWNGLSTFLGGSN